MSGVRRRVRVVAAVERMRERRAATRDGGDEEEAEEEPPNPVRRSMIGLTSFESRLAMMDSIGTSSLVARMRNGIRR